MQWARKQTGFTIVELLIVVVVIAILAAITVVAYTGISNRAKESNVATKVSQSVKKIEAFKATSLTGSYPNDTAAAGIANIQGLQYFYNAAQPTLYCVQSVDGAVSYSATSTSTTPRKGTCLNNGLVGWWRLNGNGDDSSGNGWGLTTLAGTPAQGQNAQANSAYEFNGSVPAASIAGSEGILPETHSFSFWYYANSWNSGAATSFVAKRSGTTTGQFIMRLTASNSLSIDCGGSSNRWTPGVALPTGVWTHIVVTCSPTAVGAYMQGSDLGVAARTTTTIANSTVLQFGQDGSGYALNGRMDDIRLFDRILNQAEVTQLYGDGAQ